MMKKLVKLKENINSEGPQLMSEFNLVKRPLLTFPLSGRSIEV